MTTSLTTSREGRKSARRLPSTVLAMEAAGSRADRSPLCGRGAAGGLPAPRRAAAGPGMPTRWLSFTRTSPLTQTPRRWNWPPRLE